MAQNPPVNEMYVIRMLLASPHPLSRAWTDGDPKAIATRVANVLKHKSFGKLTPDAHTETLSFVQSRASARHLFRALADTLKDQAYLGIEPHPTLDEHNPDETETLLAAARQADGNP